MTLKKHVTELSQKAKAFSVESLLNEKKGQEVNDSEKELKFSSKLLTWNNITAELCYSDLWNEFNCIGTEMIVTRAGRRMFPTLKVRLQGLQSSTTYIVYLDIVPVNETKYRYNYNRCEWRVVGPSKNVSTNNIFIHGESPSKGEIWTSKGFVSFDKLKLTNHRKSLVKDQVSLESMRKYQPRIHILEVSDKEDVGLIRENIEEFIKRNSEKSVAFVFEQTTFITVTAYQNQRITNLKIQSNPFAKGFRQIQRTKRKMKEEKSELERQRTKEFLRSNSFNIQPNYFNVEQQKTPFGKVSMENWEELQRLIK